MTLGGYWPPSLKVEIADFWGGRIVCRGRDVFFASIFLVCTWNQNFFFRFQAGKFSSAAPTSEPLCKGLDEATIEEGFRNPPWQSIEGTKNWA
jgi:hypothetical protein